MTQLRGTGRVAFLGIDFDQLSAAEALVRVKALAQPDKFEYVVTPNVDHLVRLHSNPENKRLWAAYQEASVCLCDSRIIQRLAQLSHLNLSAVPGSDLTAALLSDQCPSFTKVLIIGGDTDLSAKLESRYPQYEWYQHIPPMGVRENADAQEAIVKVVQSTPAELVLFAIGSPQSELLCLEIRRRGGSGLGLCIGASLEFLTGAKKRAPVWMQRLALEWLFRLLVEPRRLWRRYLVEGPRIFEIWWRWRFTRFPPCAECDSTNSAEP